MAFVNEIVSEEDIKKYGLDELMKEFSSWEWRDGRPVGFVHLWAIDRARDIFFLLVKSIEEVGPSGRPEATTKTLCILSWRGSRIKLTIDKAVGSSTRFSDSPFRIVWDLLALDLSQLPHVSREEVVQVLKDALTTFGHRGAYRQYANTLVEFKF